MENYISIRQILDNILDHPMLQDVTLERAVNYAVELIRKIGMPKIFEEKTAILEICDYRAKLPCDFDNMIQVRLADHDHRIFRAASDSFHLSPIRHYSADLTYKIQNSAIFTSISKGMIEIVYKAIPTDCDGFPLIPDNSSFAEALEYYIKKKQFTKLFDQGKITAQSYAQCCKDYAWAVGQARADLTMPTLDEMESINNMWNTLVPRVTEHNKGFINSGSKEILKAQ